MCSSQRKAVDSIFYFVINSLCVLYTIIGRSRHRPVARRRPYAGHRPGHLQGGEDRQVGVGFPRLAGRFVSVTPASAPYPGVSAAPPREFVGVDDA